MNQACEHFSLTDWFSEGTKPLESRPGLYQKESVYQIPYYSYWDGTYWYAVNCYKEKALKNYADRLVSTLWLRWRGVHNMVP